MTSGVRGRLFGVGCWFRIALVWLLCLGVAVAEGDRPVRAHTVAEQYLFQSVNAERAAAGLRPVVWSEPLTDAAAYHAARMLAAREISHQFRDEADVVGRAALYGVRFSRVAENVATSPNVLEMHAALMRSLHHRENILDPQVDRIGIAVVASGRQLWAVEDFALDVREMSLEEQEREVGGLLQDAGLAHVSESAAARATCGMETGYSGARPSFVMRYTTGDLDRLPEELSRRLARGEFSAAAVGACAEPGRFATYRLAVLLYR